ncbi:glycosyltransferase [Carnobacterium inhibens]|uniref:Glycosyl transferase family 28 C-terminal domain-containing protein n=1 Tax=Carnobacterium inhibens subsp. gilichinskyi TaxID=1266845 RepID=U5SCQ1_9LACT|nr:glycosyltransferase [Carnobacterium inhibens]AGY82826.1 hypothetical protein Q783_06895 [Carnobacterium inhibens subsp. gilichinskyi]
MKYKWIAFYVSSHGFGHMTRCLAIIEEVLEKTDYRIYLVCGEFQNNFAKNYLMNYEDRIIFSDVCTDIGLINFQNTLKINNKELEENLWHFINSWETIVEKESQFLSKFDIHHIVSDISPIGALVGKKLKAKNIGISNFTWVEQYESLGIDKDIIEEFKIAYSNFDYFIEYPLALPMDNLNIPKKSIGFITRKIELNRVNEIKETYGKSIFVTCGRSANLKNISIKNYDGTIFTTSGIDILGSNKVIKLPVDTLDTQNYIAASDIIISKAGWSTISEAVVANKKLVLIEREDVLEDSHNIQQLKQQNRAISIKEEELENIDILDIEQRIDKSVQLGVVNKIRENEESILNILGINAHSLV